MNNGKVDLVQFQAKYNNRIRGQVTRNFYKYNREDLHTLYKYAVEYYLAYVYAGTPSPKFQHTITIARKPWLQLISYLLYGTDKFQGIETSTMMNWTLDDVCKILDIEKKILTPQEYTIPFWGPRYWNFLHITSFLVDGRQNIIKAFASLMYIFNLMLICSTCSQHYMEKKPLLTVTVPMLESSDPITTIFNLHNTVNAATNKPQYSLEAFCNKYNAEIYGTDTVVYDTTIVL